MTVSKTQFVGRRNYDRIPEAPILFVSIGGLADAGRHSAYQLDGQWMRSRQLLTKASVRSGAVQSKSLALRLNSSLEPLRSTPLHAPGDLNRA
jgi:hypothetical protein